MADRKKKKPETSDRLLQRREDLLAEVARMRDILHGSWLERYSTCSQKDCDCHKGHRHGPRFYVVVLKDGRQRQKYVPTSQVDAARRGIARHHQLQECIREITAINLELLRRKEYDNAQ